ncbi:retrovirus-related pol polyprotein from transposon TNT 1-94 [Tanacetum coccineum]
MLQMFHLLLLLSMTGCPDRPLVSGLRMFKTYDREPLSAHELRLRHNLFSIGQFCDADLEVTFQKNTCFIRNLEGVDLLSGSRDTNLYTISLDDMLKTSLICLLSKASNTKSWLWHCRLSHLNFGKIKKSSHQPKDEDTNQEKLYLLHMDLCGSIRVESINGKRYILVIVDDYSRFTWVKYLRSKDEAPDAIIKCIKNIQVHLHATVRNVRTDNGTEFTKLDSCGSCPHNVDIFKSSSVPMGRRNQHSLTNDSEDLGKLNAKADIGIFVGYAPTKKAFKIYNRRTRKIIETIHVTFNELTYFNRPTIAVSTVPVAAVPRAVEITDSPVSTSIDQDAPSSSIPSTQDQEHSIIISQGVKESPKTLLFHDDPLYESLHEDSTS